MPAFDSSKLFDFGVAQARHHAAVLKAQLATSPRPATVIPLPEPPDTPIPDLWEDLVTVMEREEFVSNWKCYACGATLDPEHEAFLTHVAGCKFERLDKAMMRLRDRRFTDAG